MGPKFDINSQISGLRSTEVWLCNRIGDPVNRPQVISVQIHLERGGWEPDLADSIRGIIHYELIRMPFFCNQLAAECIPIG